MNERLPGDHANPDDPALSDLYRSTRAEQPSTQLDRAIRARALAQTPRRQRRWLIPVATAAVVVLGATLTLRVLQLPPPARGTKEPEISGPATRQPARSSAAAREGQPQTAARRRKAERSVQSAPQPAPAQSGIMRRSSPERTPEPRAPARGPSPPAGANRHTQKAFSEPAAPRLDVYQSGRDAQRTLNTMSEPAAPAGAAGAGAAPRKPDPAALLARIRRLLARGDLAAARLDLSKFRLYFPAEPVPPDILKTLGRARDR